MASGPEQLEPGEWLRLVFDEPVFDNGDQAETMLDLTQRLYWDIETRLEQPGSLRPMLDRVRDRPGGKAADALAWCQGHFSGMSLRREHCSMHAGRMLDSLLTPIHELSRQRALIEEALHNASWLSSPGRVVPPGWHSGQTIQLGLAP